MMFQWKNKFKNMIALALVVFLVYPSNFVQAATLEPTTKKSFILSDHLGSTISVVNESGIEESHTEYKSFGSIKEETGKSTLKRKFTGKELDDSTGLYDYEARQYDANIGRFITADTIDPKLDDPQTLNRYSYALNNPLKYIDPTGHSAQEVTSELQQLLPGYAAVAPFLATPAFQAAVLVTGVITAVAILSNPEVRGTTFPSSGPIGVSVYFAKKASSFDPVDPTSPKGSARAAESEVAKKDIVVRRFGEKNDPHFGKKGSVEPGTHATTDRRIKRSETAQDKLDLRNSPSGYRDFKIRKGDIISRGKVPGGEFGGSGGKTEIINRSRLPRGSAGKFRKLR